MTTKTYVEGRWGQVHVRLAGKPTAPPLLMLHPTPKSGWIYERLMAQLAPGRAVFAPDTPGYGASDAPPAPPSIEDHAEAMFGVVERLAADGMIADTMVDLLGYHTGSSIAVAMANMRPRQVRRLILVSVAAYDADVRAEKRAALAHWPRPAEDGSHLGRMWALMRSLSDARVDTAWLHESLTENLRCGARAPWGYDAVYRHDLQSALDALAHDTLILNPQDDLWDLTRAHASRVRGAQYVEMPGVAHGLFDLEVERIAALIEEFLRR
ncbi:alpha/beta fold hydrolase [Sphingobium sp. AR-3-1]|uniref:Alpha/beta fold hydrolase n=1 Tax=Sphingobium psychrophilum TaxID=2728834 RepID=A0A7X9ZU27_9SPHN|nr:alpha/beta fold hydrolase [Sphingobium psychrophilum]NML12247.1 alpha/beta fold hydrolase [Sphingobium psychrophilum]